MTEFVVYEYHPQHTVNIDLTSVGVNDQFASSVPPEAKIEVWDERKHFSPRKNVQGYLHSLT